MSDQPTSEPRDRLGPRPLERPSVDPHSAAVFRRPAGVSGAFAPPPGGVPATRSMVGNLTAAPPRPEVWSSAFGRPKGSDEVLQRPPARRGGAGRDREPDADLWTTGTDADPWRDPAAGAVIGPPALGVASPAEGKDMTRPAAAMLSVPELLFGRRVKPTALGVLALVALLVGAAGGLVGWLLASEGNALSSEVTLAQVEPGKERPTGSVSEIAKRVAPGVVSIELKGNQVAGVGSGVVIDGKGYIVTNDHVVSARDQDSTVKITAVFIDGTRAEANVVGRDPKTDLAVIKVQVANPTVVRPGNSDDLQVGDSVIAIGSPLGLDNTVTEGIVSALHRPVVAGGDDGGSPVTYDAIQTDAAINKGNSGGALVDSTGALVGINSAIRSSQGSTGNVGIGFAIPVNLMKRITESLIRDGRVAHADMGVNVKSVSAETAEGAQVLNVTDGGAAQRAGIEEGDVITKVGDRQVRDAAELTVAVREHRPGHTVPVVLARQGQQLTIQVTLQSD
jgi:S1-C subfamily serine protease